MLKKLTKHIIVSYYEEHLVSEFYLIYAISHLMILFTELDLWLHQTTIMNCNHFQKKMDKLSLTLMSAGLPLD